MRLNLKKLLNFFNRNNRNNKNPVNKRQIIVSVILVGNFFFSNFKLNEKPLNERPFNQKPLIDIDKKIISNQQLDSFDGSENSKKIIRTGNGTILEFQNKITNTKN